MVAVGLQACNGLIYDSEGDCDPYYKVRFVYDTNLKFTDAFHAEVFEVTLYLVDPVTGRVVWQKHESGQELRQQGYLMDVDVKPGTYTLLAWCGEGHKSSFSVADSDHHTELRCRLADRKTHTTDDRTMADTDLARLYHGMEQEVLFEDEQGTHIKTVRLVKDTNNVHIVLQHLSGENIDHKDYTFHIEADNGHMDYDNSLIEGDHIVYHPHTALSGQAGIELPDYTGGSRASGVITQVSAAVAHHTVGRLVEGNDVRVKIFNKDGDQIVSIPLIDYALLVKGNYTRPDGSVLTNQEYLDHQDEYSMVFLLDEHGRWMNQYIYVNSWRVILQDTDI